MNIWKQPHVPETFLLQVVDDSQEGDFFDVLPEHQMRGPYTVQMKGAPFSSAHVASSGLPWFCLSRYRSPSCLCSGQSLLKEQNQQLRYLTLDRENWNYGKGGRGKV